MRGVALQALEAHPDVCLDIADHVAEMDRSIGVGQGIGDKDLAGHGAERRKADCDYRMPLPVFRPEFSLNSGPEFSLDRCRSEEHTSELQSLMRISYAVFCLKKKKKQNN